MRKGMVDFWRFAACIAIVIYHQRHLGYQAPYFFSSGWIFVEFFFMVSGYYAARHFWKGRLPEETTFSDAQIGQKASAYTIAKFKRLCRYYIPAILLAYMINWSKIDSWNFEVVATQAEKLFRQLLLLTSAAAAEGNYGVATPSPLWYLSALLIVAPIVYVLLQSRYSDIYAYVISWVFPILYYGRAGFAVRGVWPRDFLRAFCDLSLGVFIYVLSIKLNRYFAMSQKQQKEMQVLATIVEIGSMILTFILCCFGTTHFELVIMLWVAGLTILFSDISYTRYINGSIFNLLGKMSMIIFIFHRLSASLLVRLEAYQYFPSDRIYKVAYFVLAMAISCMVYLIECLIVKRKNKVNSNS